MKRDEQDVGIMDITIEEFNHHCMIIIRDAERETDKADEVMGDD